MTAHRWLIARAAHRRSDALYAGSSEGSCGSLSSRDRRRQHELGRTRRRELRHVESFGGSTAGAPTLASCALPLRANPLTPRVLSHRRDITPAQAPRDGSAHSCGSTQNYGATPPRLGAAHGSNRCRPTTRLLPLPLSAMRPLRQCTPQTRRQIPLRLATFAAMRPPPAAARPRLTAGVRKWTVYGKSWWSFIVSLAPELNRHGAPPPTLLLPSRRPSGQAHRALRRTSRPCESSAQARSLQGRSRG